ncbi:hypothetical protein [Paludisphaera sp.]|uniref:hypothetical protein n=1 Tax=Paludisphaera sp. TaxID=2017432 RepID=UPI00301C3A37
MLAVAVLCLASLAQVPPDRPVMLRGTVIERGTDRPVAGVSVRVSEGFDAPTVTTDAQGRFDGLPAADANVMPVNGQMGPMFRVRAEDDRAWPWTTPGADREPVAAPDFRRNQVVWAVYEQQVTSRWKGQGPQAELVVDCPPVGVVEAVVRGPDGRPLADTPIVLVPGRGLPFFSIAPVHVSGRTDNAGAFRIREFGGQREFGIRVAGVGFGSTGLVEVAPGRVSRPEIPPLARFARIEGRVDDSLKAPGSRVDLMTRAFNEASAPSAGVDEDGRFTLDDVVPGDYTLRLRRGAEAVAAQSTQVWLGPGQVSRDVMVSPAPPPSPELEQARQRMARQMGGEPGREVGWVEGTVRDDEARPLAGATVLARVNYNGGMRMATDVKKTTTDAEGRYRVEGPMYPMMGMIFVVVAAKDRPPLVAHAMGLDPSLDPKDQKPARLDMTVGSRGGSLAVKVVQDGRKAPGATVRLVSTETGQGFQEIGRPVDPGELDEMREITVPTAVTGADGVARFQNVAPGLYDAYAFPDVDPGQPFAKKAVRPGVAFLGMAAVQGYARGIEVAPGGRAEVTLGIDPEPSPTRFLVLGPDGAPAANRAISVGMIRGRETSGGGVTMARTDAQGVCSVALRPGLWTLDVRYGDSEPNSYPIQTEPYYQAAIQVPASPALAEAGPITLRAERRERGALKVRLLGPDGAPARGGVVILPLFPSGGANQGATVDQEGWARFADMPSGKYRLRGFIDGSDPAPRPRYGRQLSDDELSNRAMMFDRETTVESGKEAVAELRMEPVGYVRATIHPPADRSPTDFTAALRGVELPGEFPTFEVSEDRARYLFGPAPVGRWPVVVVPLAMVGGAQPRNEREVEVETSRVVHVDVDAPAGAPRAEDTRNQRFAMIPTGGIDLQYGGPEAVAVTVVMADGATPAFGARALFIAAGASEPALMGTADAAGRLTWTGISRGGRPDGEGPEPVKEPTIVAWAPGLAGPAVATVKPGEPLRMTLPEPAGAAGRATVGGAAISGGDARIRVVLATEGKGAVAAAMRREATADADGRFRFPALAPGRYVVQAIRDELWASKLVPLVVAPGEEAKVAVDVPAPGATVALELVDRRGEPIAAAFSIKPLAGPIADLAPIAGRSGDDGRALLRGLPAGLLGLAVEGVPSPFALDVPPARAGAGPLDIRVEVAGQGP